MSVRWTTSPSIDRVINKVDDQGWTPYRMIDWRRRHNMAWARSTNNTPDHDPEKVYHSFIGLIQKIVDDHYGFKEHQDESLRRVKIAPGKNAQFFEIVERPSLGELTYLENHLSNTETSESEDEETEWHDAQDISQ